MRRFLVPVLALSLLTSACFGTFQATRAVWNFNRDVGNKWLQEVVFLVFAIAPVYFVAGLVDVLALNTIEFWTGDNPMARTRVPVGEGRYVELERSEDGTLTVRDGDKVVRIVRDEAGLQATDAAGQVIATAHEVDGAFVMVDGAGSRSIDARAMARAATGPEALRELIVGLGGAGAVCAAR
jgi:hypothetical protein